MGSVRDSHEALRELLRTIVSLSKFEGGGTREILFGLEDRLQAVDDWLQTQFKAPSTLTSTDDRSTCYRFMLTEDSQSVVDSALETAKSVMHPEHPECGSRGHVLSLICLDYLATNGGAMAGLHAMRVYLANLERLLGVNFVCIDFSEPKEQEVLFGIDSLTTLINRYQVAEEPAEEED